MKQNNKPISTNEFCNSLCMHYPRNKKIAFPCNECKLNTYLINWYSENINDYTYLLGKNMND